MIYGVPVAKGRPRFRNNGKFVQTYTPKETVNYENLVKLSWVQARGEGSVSYIEEGAAIEMDIKAYFPIPTSLSKKKQTELDGTPHIKKCDSDNIIKIICDALNEVAFKDDCAVSDITVRKRYTSEEPRVEVTYDIITTTSY